MTELAIISLGVCPDCRAEFPAFYKEAGALACEDCGWASGEIPWDQRLMSRRSYLVLSQVDAGTPSYVAFGKVTSAAIEHPEWDMEEIRRVCEWRAEDDESPG